MKLIWHLCKKDILHLRLALGLWILLLAAEIFFNQRLLSPAGVDREWFERASLLANLFALTILVVSYLMMASLVLEDPAVGTQMFWATRPISGGRLLGAKLLGILLLFGALPILVRLPWWLYCGYGPGDLGRAASQSLAAVGLMAIPALVLATLGGQSSRFLLYSLLLLVVFPMVSVSVAARSIARLSSDLVMSQVLVSLLLLAVSSLAAAVSQFLTRRLVRSVVILSAGVAVAAVCLFTWPWTLSQLWPDRSLPPTGTEPISGEILQSDVFADKNTAAPEHSRLTVTVRLTNLPADRVLLSGFVDAELRWPDGLIVRRQHVKLYTDLSGDRPPLRRALALSSPSPDPETVRKLADLREERLRHRPPVTPGGNRPRPALAADDTVGVFNLSVAPSVAARIKAEPPACSISARLTLGRPDVLFEMPLRPGAAQSGHGARLQVLDVSDEARTPEARSDETAQKWTLTLVSAASLHAKPAIYRVDRERGDLERLQNATASLPTLPTLTKIDRLSSRLTLPRLWRTDHWLNVPNWLSAQTLAVVTLHEEPGYVGMLQTDRLPSPATASE